MIQKRSSLTVPPPNPNGEGEHVVIVSIERQPGLQDVLITRTPIHEETAAMYQGGVHPCPEPLKQRARVLWQQRAERTRTLLQPALRHIEGGHYFPELLQLAREIAAAERLDGLVVALADYPERHTQDAQAEWSFAALKLWCRERSLFLRELREINEAADAVVLGTVDPAAR